MMFPSSHMGPLIGRLRVRGQGEQSKVLLSSTEYNMTPVDFTVELSCDEYLSSQTKDAVGPGKRRWD